MENASKALLIAGAVMAIMCIVQIGVMIYNGSADVVKRTVGQIDTMEISLHNQAFQAYYEEKISGEELGDCISKAILANTNAPEKEFKITITINNNIGSKIIGPVYVSANQDDPDAEEIRKRVDRISMDISPKAKYIGTAKMNSQGIVNQIDFLRLN